MEFSEEDGKVSEMTIRGGGIGTIGIPVAEVMEIFHSLCMMLYKSVLTWKKEELASTLALKTYESKIF